MDYEKLSLSQWGLPEGVLTNYKKRGIEKMFPWQLECLCTGAVLEGENLVYTAPTSAGKTLVAEILVAQTIFDKRKKALIILPFVSVVREKMFYFQDLFSSNGIRVEGFMGGHTPSASYHQTYLGVCTIEKANALINRMLEEKTLSKLGIVVVDEMHLLGDPYRGYLLELLLTKLLYMSKIDPDIKLQIVGMSATLPNLNMLAKWLHARLYYTDFRPIPLTEQVKCGKQILNSKFEKIRDIDADDIDSDDDSENLGHLCIETIRNGHSVLIFCPTKVWCESLACKLAAYFRKVGSSDKALIEGTAGWALRRQLVPGKLMEVLSHLKSSPVGLDKELAKTVPYGVAFHHAGLTLDERDIVEGSFRKSYLRVLCATSTLSSGVNLPARRVIIRSPMSFGSVMDVLTYRQMIGRAGRMGVDTEGESILICKPTEKIASQQLVCGNLKPVESCLGSGRLSASLKRAILEVVASGIVTSAEQLQAYAASTFLASSSKGGMEDPLTSCLQFLIENEFIRKQDDKLFCPTPLGQACLASSLPPDEGLALFRELERARRCFVLDSDLHIIYQVTPYSVSEQWSNIDWLRVLNMLEEMSPSMRRVADLVGVEDNFLAKVVKGSVSASLPEQKSKLSIHRRFYTALALQDLVHEISLSDVARKFDCNKGMLQSLQQSAATYAGMVAEFAKRLRWNTIELIVSQFQERLQFGVQRELCELMRLPSLNGIRARTLFSAGFTTLAEIANSETSDLEKAMIAAKPFESKGKISGETGYEHAQRSRLQAIWITGRSGLSPKEAADILIKEARTLLELELGVEAVWSNERTNLGQCIKLNLNHSLTSDIAVTLNKTEKFNVALENNESNGIEVLLDDSEDKLKNITGNDKILGESSEKNQVADTTNSQIDVPQNMVVNENVNLSNKETSLNAASCYNQTYIKTDSDHSMRDDSEIQIVSSNNVQSTIPRNNSASVVGLSVMTTHHHFDKLKNIDYTTVPNVQSSHLQPSISKQVNETDYALNGTEHEHIGRRGSPNEVIDVDFDDFILESCCEWDATKAESRLSNNDTPTLSDSSKKFGSNSRTLTVNSYNQDTLTTKRIQSFCNDGMAMKESRGRLSTDLFDGSPKTFSTPVALSKLSSDSTNSPDLFSMSLTFDTNIDTECRPDQKTPHEDVGQESPLNSDDLGFFSDSSPVIVTDNSNSEAIAMESVSESFFVKQSMPINPLKRKASPDFIPDSDDTLTKNTKRPRLRLKSDFPIYLRRDVEIVTLDTDDDEEIEGTPPSLLIRSSFSQTVSHNEKGSSKLPANCHNSESINQQTQVLKNSEFGNCMNDVAHKIMNWESFNIVDVCGNEEVFQSFHKELKEQPIIGIALGCRKKELKQIRTIGRNFLKEVIPVPQESHRDGIIECNDLILDGIAFYWQGNDVFYMSIGDSGCLREDRTLVLRDLNTRTLRMLDVKEQLKYLHRFTGVSLEANFEDPKLAAWLMSSTPGESSLIAMLAEHLPESLKLSTILGPVHGNNNPGLTGQSNVEAKSRACCEVLLAFQLMNTQLASSKFSKYIKVFHEVEMPTIRVLADMELNGFPFDANILMSTKDDLENYVCELERRGHMFAGRKFALSSYAATAKVLYSELRLGKQADRGKKSRNTGKEALKALSAETQHPLPGIILQWRKVKAILAKVIFPFLQLLPETRVYGSSHYFTLTGRISMKEPNLQSIPKDFEIESDSDIKRTVCLRDIFVATAGWILLSADYCQIELRLLAQLSGDFSLIETIISTKDIFISIAATIFGVPESQVSEDQRQRAKNTCYGIIYGIGGRTLGQQLEIEEDAAQKLMDDFKSKYEGVRLFLNKTVADCRSNGYVETMSGRRRYLPSITSNVPSLRSEAERQAINTTVQGSAADLVKTAMVNFRAKCQISNNMSQHVRLLLHLHDELIYEVSTDHLATVAKILRNCMENAWSLNVPFPVKLKSGSSWGSLKSLLL